MADKQLPKVESTTKPNFDGRKHYFEILSMCLVKIQESIFNRDYGSWLDSIYSFYSLTRPFLKDTNKIDDLIEELNRQINKSKSVSINYNGIYKSNIFTYYWAVNTELMEQSKELLLPITSRDDDTEFNSNTFFGGSDL